MAAPGTVPTTIFTFPAVLDQILTDVIILLSDFAIVINKQTQVLENQNQQLANQATQIASLTALTTQVTALNTDVSNAVNLMELVVQGLGNVATLDIENQQIDLLNTIIQNQAPNRPRHIVLDLSTATRTHQMIPTSPGP